MQRQRKGKAKGKAKKRTVLMGGPKRGGPFNPLLSSSSPLKIMRPLKNSTHSYSLAPFCSPSVNQEEVLEEDSAVEDDNDNGNKDFRKVTKPAIKALPPSLKPVSARKLAASLWELQGISVMKKGAHPKDSSFNESSGTRDRLPLGVPQNLYDPSHGPTHPIQVTMSNGSRKGQSKAALKHSHALSERHTGAVQALTPGSASSSVEVGGLDQSVTPTSSLDLRIRQRDPNYSLTTSTDLLKVLNRIWSLEEQHASSMSLVTALRAELDRARARVHELIQEQRADHHQMDNLVKRFTDEKMIWKSKEQEKIRAAVQSVRDELQDERKLRRRSESLHRKLARELAEIKTSFAKVLQDLEKERKGRALVEDFCDELAIEVTKDSEETEETTRDLNKAKIESIKKMQLLGIAEQWKEERVHLKLAEARFDLEQKEEITERIRSQVVTFLKDRRKTAYSNHLDDAHQYRRQSLESLHLNFMSAARDASDEESIDSDIKSIELNRNSLNDNNSRAYKLKYSSAGVPNELLSRRSCEQHPTFQHENNIQRFQEKSLPFEGRLGNVKSWQRSKEEFLEKLKSGQLDSIKQAEGAKEENQDTEEEYIDSRCLRTDMHATGKGLRHVNETLARTQSIQSECSGTNEDLDNTPDYYPSRTSWRTHGGGIEHLLGIGLAPSHGFSSPIRQWDPQPFPSDSAKNKGSSDRSKGIRENSLKAKLLEARLEGQQSRLRSTKG